MDSFFSGFFQSGRNIRGFGLPFGPDFMQMLQGMQEPHTIPTSQNLVNNLQTVKLDETRLKSLKDKNESQCSICVSEMNIGDEVVFLPCFHTFHESCIKPWLEQNHFCPVCRYELPT